MAISAVHYQLLKEHAPLLARGGSLLEIGEANWYGDMGLDEVRKGFTADTPILLDDLFSTLEDCNSFDVVKIIYHLLFEPSSVDSIDFNGTPDALRQDLNGPLQLPRLYDTIINHGTAEHIFNIAMVFKSIHDWCKTGGYMIHESPFTGWVDHGFYCLQPTLFYDVAAANEYELVSLSICEINSRTILRVESREHFHQMAGNVPRNAILFVVMRKAVDAPFRVPMQGYYDSRLSEKGKEAWQTCR